MGKMGEQDSDAAESVDCLSQPVPFHTENVYSSQQGITPPNFSSEFLESRRRPYWTMQNSFVADANIGEFVESSGRPYWTMQNCFVADPNFGGTYLGSFQELLRNATAGALECGIDGNLCVDSMKIHEVGHENSPGCGFNEEALQDDDGYLGGQEGDDGSVGKSYYSSKS